MSTDIAAQAKRISRAWRHRRRMQRLVAQEARLCDVCATPMPDGRTDRRQCSPACRQKAYRRRKACRHALGQRREHRRLTAGRAPRPPSPTRPVGRR
jgi:hypothetical protein